MPRELHVSIGLDADTRAHRSAAPLTAAHWTDLIGLAEQGAADFVTVHDSFAPPAEDSRGRPDAVALLARAAPVTSRIGLVPTVTTTHTEPFHTATALATLDHVSEGRAGWLVDVSTGEDEARAVGRRTAAPEAELWDEAADAAEVAARLWDSWDDDAEIRDTATGRFIDRERLHHIDFEGPYFSVRGPSIVPRPPQGRPPVVVSVAAGPPDGAPRHDGHGRHEGQGTGDGAAARWETAARHADVVLLDARDQEAARHARSELLDRVAESGRDPDTVRILVRVAVALRGISGPPASPPADTVGHTGSTEQLARLLSDWHAATGVDGFHLHLGQDSGDLAALVHELLPGLRERGLFRDGYTGRTLRDHLRLSRPLGRYTRPRQTETAP